VFISNLARAQQLDSLNFVLPTDTLIQKSIQKADSITLAFQSKADSLQDLYLATALVGVLHQQAE
jgi:hypothetical protein